LGKVLIAMPLEKLPTKMSGGFGLSMLDRAVKEFHAVRCKPKDLEPLRQYFRKSGQIRCFYCERQPATRWDHVHPLTRGGDTQPGNLVPACGPCDDSKQHREIDEWAQSVSKHSPRPEQAQRIKQALVEYRKQFPYEPREFEAKLSAAERESYKRFQEQLQALRTHLIAAGWLKERKKD